VLTGGDCNDNNAAIHPGAVEIPNNRKDDNCNGQVDEILITSANSRGAATEAPESLSAFNINITPVHSNDQFNIFLQGTDKMEKITLRIFDHIGRLMEVRANLLVGQRLTIGKSYAKGYYIVEAMQGNKKISVIVIKL
jgi:hypothetical protein